MSMKIQRTNMDEQSTVRENSSQIHSSKHKPNISKQDLDNTFKGDDILFHKNVETLSSQLSHALKPFLMEAFYKQNP